MGHEHACRENNKPGTMSNNAKSDWSLADCCLYLQHIFKDQLCMAATGEWRDSSSLTCASLDYAEHPLQVVTIFIPSLHT